METSLGKMFKDEQDQPNTILNRFDCLHSDVNNESWEELRENSRDRCVTTKILISETQILIKINDIVLHITLHTHNFL